MTNNASLRGDARHYACMVRPMPGDGKGWVAEFPDIPGCFATGATRAEATSASEAALQRWLDQAHSLGITPPTPGSGKAATGQFRIRVPKSVHRALAVLANRSQLSLNETVVQLLYRAVARSFDQDLDGGICMFLGMGRTEPRRTNGSRFDPHRDFAGHWLQRIPELLHQQLIAWAQAEGISLNGLIIFAIVRELERSEAGHEPLALPVGKAA